jgi:hypothetical protein
MLCHALTIRELNSARREEMDMFGTFPTSILVASISQEDVEGAGERGREREERYEEPNTERERKRGK